MADFNLQHRKFRESLETTLNIIQAIKSQDWGSKPLPSGKDRAGLMPIIHEYDARKVTEESLPSLSSLFHNHYH